MKFSQYSSLDYYSKKWKEFFVCSRSHGSTKDFSAYLVYRVRWSFGPEKVDAHIGRLSVGKSVVYKYDKEVIRDVFSGLNMFLNVWAFRFQT